MDEDSVICDSCGEEGNDISYCRDPFLWEVHGEEVLRNLCEDCYCQRALDV